VEIIQQTLPIQLSPGIDLNIEAAQAMGKKLSAVYTQNQPFPHIVIDDFLPRELIDKIDSHFPASVNQRDKHFESGYRGLHKRQINPNFCENELRHIFYFFNSAPMLQFLVKLTSIECLLPDPYFSGGGMHETRSGGFLGIHSDFRVAEHLRAERRLNLIIYLNKDWKEDYGGNLELWDASMKNCIRKVAPIYNRCVIFNTDAKSFHGHPDPLNTPEGITRRSIALYYYTASEKVLDDIKYRETVYRPRPEDPLKLRAKYFVKNSMKKIRSYWA